MFPFWEQACLVRVIAQRTLRAFWEKHPKAEQPLRSWLQEMKRGSFRRPSDVRRHYRSADFVGDDRVIFNIGGNKYRLVVHMSYRRQIAFIKFIGTHKQYDRIDAATVGRGK
jgi:mRNA interferase HigB